mgnify:CR=1 FL=1
MTKTLRKKWGDMSKQVYDMVAMLESRDAMRVSNKELQGNLDAVMAILHGIADDICLVRSMFTDQFNHAPAEMLLFTGSPRGGRPSMGAWTVYGLGSENENLPGFVVLISSGVQPSAGASAFGSGFLPSVFQGVQCRSKGDPVLYVSDPKGMDRDTRRKTLDALRDLNEMQAAELGHPETATRIQQYELAFRMQTAVPEVMDIAREPKSVLDLYGAKPGAASFANNCLLARRLIERGVRVVELYDADWDHHSGIATRLPAKCRDVDQAMAGLITDLKTRGMLDDTMVIWASEFGRTPLGENRVNDKDVSGRDHHPFAFSMWLAGGGIRPGITHGATDELGFHVASDEVHVHDLQATILWCLGLDHERLSVRFQGLDLRLTGVEPCQVVKGILG